MFLGQSLQHSARVITVLTALLPLYMTLTTIQEAPFLSKKGREAVSNPIAIALIAYGTGYASLGDASVTLNVMLSLIVAASYVFVLRPDIGEKYFDTQYLKDSLKGKPK